MLPLNVERARLYGISAPYQSIDDVMIQDPSNPSRCIVNRTLTTISWSKVPAAIMNIKKYQNSIGLESGGWGFDFPLLYSLMGPTLTWLVVLLVIRYACREPIARFGMYMGVVTENEARYRSSLAEGKRGTAALSLRNQKRLYKFQNQVWLALCYICSSIFGYIVQRNQPWFTFPTNELSGVHFLIPHPYNPPATIVVYYHYSLAFYASELLSIIFFEKHVRRSDFIEYFIHHIFTMILIGGSFIGWEHRYGAYVIFIHDASDIMLCVSKVFHYIVQEEQRRVRRAKAKGQAYQSPKMFKILNQTFERVCFFIFVIVFLYFRLYCLPMLARSTLGMTPHLHHGNVNLWILVVLLNVFLQLLHLYWTSLILRMVISFLKHEDVTDVRSEPDETQSEEPDYVPWDVLGAPKVKVE